MVSFGSTLAMSRAYIFAFVGLVACWTLASLIPRYSEQIHDTIAAQLARTRVKLPTLKIDFHPERDPRTAFNSSKLALLIEARPIPHLVPQILHMMYVVPPDWRFLFIGSNHSVVAVGRSFATKFQQVSGKLDLMVAPEPFHINSKEDVFRMLTDKRFYSELLPGVEWILKYEADSIMCSNSNQDLNNWLDYDWAGAPRTPDDNFAGNGGLSLRRVSAIQKVLEYQTRENNSQPEDEWFGKRMLTDKSLKVASASDESHFAVEEVWHERPMGYHIRETGKLPKNVWQSREQRRKILEYCPEIAIILPMKLERERCEGDDGEGGLINMPVEERGP